MRRKSSPASPEQSLKQMQELSQRLGPDHARVARLKKDVAFRTGLTPKTPYPLSPQSPIDINAATSTAKAATGLAHQAARVAELAKHAEMARFFAELDVPVANLAKPDES